MREGVGGVTLRRITDGMTGLTTRRLGDGSTVYGGTVAAGLIARESGLKVPIQASYPLAQADQALKALTTQHTQGKVAVTLP